jgi:hypothetical protein
MRVGCCTVSPDCLRTCSDQCTASAAELHFKYNGPLHEGMKTLMYQEKPGKRFVSFATIAQEFLFTASREHSKYTSLKTKCKHAMDAQADGDAPEGTIVRPLTNFFWSRKDRQNVIVSKQAAKVEREVQAKKKTDDARERKQAERRQSKATSKKEGKATKPRYKRKNVRQQPAGSDDDTTESDGNDGGKQCFRTCSDSAQEKRKRSLTVKVLLYCRTCSDVCLDPSPEERANFQVQLQTDAVSKARKALQKILKDKKAPLIEVSSCVFVPTNIVPR